MSEYMRPSSSITRRPLLLGLMGLAQQVNVLRAIPAIGFSQIIVYDAERAAEAGDMFRYAPKIGHIAD